MRIDDEQLTWGLRVFRDILIALALFFFAGLVGYGYLAIFNNSGQGGKPRIDVIEAMLGLSTVMLVVLLHGYIVLRARRLTSHTISDVIVPILLIPLMILFLGNLVGIASVIYTRIEHGYFGSGLYVVIAALSLLLASILVIGLRMKPLLAFSIPSNWISIIPLALSYVMFMNPYIWLAGMIFPTHRRVKEYWRPKPLPRIRHRPLKDGKT